MRSIGRALDAGSHIRQRMGLLRRHDPVGKIVDDRAERLGVGVGLHQEHPRGRIDHDGILQSPELVHIAGRCGPLSAIAKDESHRARIRLLGIRETEPLERGAETEWGGRRQDGLDDGF